jgi:hypothetical protein
MISTRTFLAAVLIVAALGVSPALRAAKQIPPPPPGSLPKPEPARAFPELKIYDAQGRP